MYNRIDSELYSMGCIQMSWVSGVCIHVCAIDVQNKNTLLQITRMLQICHIVKVHFQAVL